MTFDNTSIGLLLFYTIGALFAVFFALVYWASKKDNKKSAK